MTNLSATSKGKFLGSQNQLINSIFDQDNMFDRLKKLADVSSDLLDDSERPTDQLRELLQYTMVADLFDSYVNQIDQRAGGYMFEAFLASLVGGNVEGGSNGWC